MGGWVVGGWLGGGSVDWWVGRRVGGRVGGWVGERAGSRWRLAGVSQVANGLQHTYVRTAYVCTHVRTRIAVCFACVNSYPNVFRRSWGCEFPGVRTPQVGGLGRKLGEERQHNGY